MTDAERIERPDAIVFGEHGIWVPKELQPLVRQWADNLAHIDQLRQRCAELERERDEAIKSSDAVCDSYAKENQQLFDRAERAERGLDKERNQRATAWQNALEAAAQLCEHEAAGSDHVFVAGTARALAGKIRALAAPAEQEQER